MTAMTAKNYTEIKLGSKNETKNQVYVSLCAEIFSALQAGAGIP
jgi:hypothetical protein